MYSFSTNLIGDMSTIEQQVTNALKEEGFGVLTEILNKKLGIDQRPYKILGACNPSLLPQDLQVEADTGLLFPCNVVVREEKDASITVAFMDPELDPEAVPTIVKRDDIREIAKQVKSRLERVKQQLEEINI